MLEIVRRLRWHQLEQLDAWKTPPDVSNLTATIEDCGRRLDEALRGVPGDGASGDQQGQLRSRNGRFTAVLDGPWHLVLLRQRVRSLDVGVVGGVLLGASEDGAAGFEAGDGDAER